MINIVVFGTGKTRQVIESGLNSHVNIVAYLDNDSDRWNKTLNDKKILSPKQIFLLDYDYVVIASQFDESIYMQLLELGINNERIFRFNLFWIFYWNGIKYNLNNLMSYEDIEVLVTGISYAQKGINAQELKKNTYNLACSNQDLYYDYNLIKWLLENNYGKLNKLKYTIIGLSYYSFQYDLSLSSMKYKSLLYYEAIGIEHNFKKLDVLLSNRTIAENIAEEIFKFNSNGGIQIDWMTNKENLYSLDEHKGRIQAEIDCNKNYPKTVEENIKIFDKYLKLLEKHNIKPIVIVAPVSKYYSKYFSKRIKDEFMEIINERKERFQFIDYFDSKLFDDSDFFDVSHLNQHGATKFTRVLNDLIEW